MYSDQNDVVFEKYCVLITNLPPSPMPVVESLKFGNMTYLQVAEHMASVSLNMCMLTCTVYEWMLLEWCPVFLYMYIVQLYMCVQCVHFIVLY